MVALPERPNDEEHAIHLVHPKHINRDGEVKASAFKEKAPGDPRRRGKSMFIQERLPNDDDGSCLNRDAFTQHSRARLPALDIRSVEYEDEETGRTESGFDLAMTPEGAKPPFEDLTDAHSDLTGPTHIDAAVHALADRYNEVKDIITPSSPPAEAVD